MSQVSKFKKPYVKKDRSALIMKIVAFCLVISLILSALVGAYRSANDTKKRNEDVAARRAFQAQFTDEQWATLSAMNFDEMSEQEIMQVIAAIKAPQESEYYQEVDRDEL